MIDNDFKFGMAVLLAFICLMFATIVACTAICVYKDCQFIKAGYTKKMLPGSHSPQWVREQPCELCGTEDKENDR